MDSIRNQILLFAILAALVPSLVTAVISYAQNRRALRAQINQELVTAASQAGREVDVWLKERLYELRVFASSYEVSENLARGVRGTGVGRLGDYLNSVRGRVEDYEELQVVDPQGRIIASSARSPGSAVLPPDWARSIQATGGVVADPRWDPAGDPILVLAVPVERPDGRLSGALLARANLSGVSQILAGYSFGAAGEVKLVAADGRVIASSRGGAAAEDAPRFSEAALGSLAGASAGVEYESPTGQAAVGNAKPLFRVPWLAVAEMSAAEAFAQIVHLRNVTLLVVAILLLVVGTVGYRLGSLIVRPLDRLTTAAAQISTGNLSVGLPATGAGEVGYLTSVFNDMVDSLRTSRTELERLSTTDPLTGLFNRRHLMKLLGDEVVRARRHNHLFSILMVDVDHFKEYNDSHGHQAGDQVLQRVGAVLKESTRGSDFAARYGGEEFLVLLSETGVDGAKLAAERIRQRMRTQPMNGRNVTVSVGLASFPSHGDTGEAIIARADAALYEAKRAGRDRVMPAEPAAPPPAEPAPKSPPSKKTTRKK